MNTHPTMRLIAAGALLCSATFLTESARAASFLISDVTHWTGPDAGPGVSQAVLVVQWPEQQAIAWGYRWVDSESKTGLDLLSAIAEANPSFSFTGTSFISNIEWQGLTFPGFNPDTGGYLNYFVNNAQQPENYGNGAAPAGAHVMPPLGSPYDEDGPGEWVASNTGALGRPLADGSWDGWIYGPFGISGPDLAVNAPVPEPSAMMLAVIGLGAACGRRRH